MMEKKKALILINAAAGTGKAANQILDIVVKLAQHGYEPVVYPVIPKTPFISEKILAEHDGQVELVLCSGGDGTLHHVIQGVMAMRHKPTLGYLPTGSTNDFARTLRLPTDFSSALDVAVGGQPFTYDIGRLNGCYFNYVAAFGAFSAVSYATSQWLKNVFGRGAYILTSLAELPEHLRYSSHMTITTDKETIEGNYLFGAICNSLSVGGVKLSAAEEVRLNDGKLELVLIKTPQKLQQLRQIVTDLKRGVLNTPFITFRQINSARIVADEPTAWTVDGEFGGKSMVTDIKVIPKAITIAAPKHLTSLKTVKALH